MGVPNSQLTNIFFANSQLATNFGELLQSNQVKRSRR